VGKNSPLSLVSGVVVVVVDSNTYGRPLCHILGAWRVVVGVVDENTFRRLKREVLPSLSRSIICVL
jgi:hypothetical protein